MFDYQIWGFTYLNFGDDNINAITGDKTEAESEFEIPCFDGMAYFEAQGKYFVCYYPKYKDLTEGQIATIKRYCGYEPKEREFGVICGALSEIKEVSKEIYNITLLALPVTDMDMDRLGF